MPFANLLSYRNRITNLGQQTVRQYHTNISYTRNRQRFSIDNGSHIRP